MPLPLDSSRDTVTDVRGVPPANDPFAYHMTSTEFLEAGKALLAGSGPRFLSQSLFLCAIGLELGLKSFLLLKCAGAPWTHDLQDLFCKASACGLGLTLSAEESTSLQQISLWFDGDPTTKKKRKHRACVYPIAGWGIALQDHVLPMFERIVAACKGTDADMQAWIKRTHA